MTHVTRALLPSRASAREVYSRLCAAIIEALGAAVSVAGKTMTNFKHNLTVQSHLLAADLAGSEACREEYFGREYQKREPFFAG